MADVHVYFERPAGKKVAGMDDLKAALTGLEHVSEVRLDAPGNVVAVSYEGGRDEQDAIEHAFEEAGYRITRLSVRSDFDEGEGLWDI